MLQTSIIKASTSTLGHSSNYPVTRTSYFSLLSPGNLAEHLLTAGQTLPSKFPSLTTYHRLYMVTDTAGLLASSQYSEGPATGHLDTGFSRFPCAYKQMLRRFPTFQVATTCFSRSPPDLNLVVTDFMFCLHVK